MRLRNVPGAPDLIAEHPQLVIPKPEECKGKWATVFEKDQPVHIEVGMGKGQFVYGMALANPDINYIGIEMFDSVIVKALEKLIENPLPNLKLLKVDARFLTDIFDENEIAIVYLNFSDPWPKNRHAKRRLTHADFLDRYKHIMRNDGEIRFKTDNRGLFEFSLMSLNAYGMQFEDLSLNLHADEPEDNVRTEYEDKWSKKGSVIYRLVAKY